MRIKKVGGEMGNERQKSWEWHKNIIKIFIIAEVLKWNRRDFGVFFGFVAADTYLFT